MDSIVLSLRKRFLIPAVLILGLIVWFSLCRAFYESYWSGTVHRVQTVDFNLLHHTLPTTLSTLIIAGRDEEIQRVLNSTFGLFGLVITDPSGQSILYKTNKVYKRKSWQANASPEGLAYEKEPFDLLTDPPPLAAVYEHKSPRHDQAEKAGAVPQSRVLGRIYYMRTAPPSLTDDLLNFFSTGPWEISGSKRGYLFITLSAVFFCMVVVLLIWLRRRSIELKQQELDHVQREVEIRQKALEHLSAELESQKNRKMWLEREAEHSYKRALGLRQALEKLKESLSLVNGQPQPAPPVDSSQSMRIRPPVHPPSALLEEIESLIPALTDNARALRSQAGLLQDYCQILEQRQQEMNNLVENAYIRAQQVSERFIDMRPGPG